jgi:hypothetical protein
MPQRLDHLNSSAHRTLNVHELLDQILEFAGPQVLLVAWNVSEGWRRSACAVLRSRHNAFFSCSRGELVEYGEPISSDTEPLGEIKADDLEESFREIRRDVIRQAAAPRSKLIYFPARLTQRDDLPDDLSQILNNLDTTQDTALYFTWLGHVPREKALRSRHTHPTLFWLDMSQLHINSYFENVFDGRTMQTRGIYDIALRPGTCTDSLLIDRTKYPPGLLKCMGAMYVTQPPCKVLGIYHSRNPQLKRGCLTDRTPVVRLLTRLHNDLGITIGEVFAALEEHATTVLSTWTARAHELADQVKTGHWQEDIWNVPGAPRFSILLDNSAMGQDDFDPEKENQRMIDNIVNNRIYHVDDVTNLTPETHYPKSTLFEGHITRHCYMFADGWRKEREAEWVPEELIEPMKSTIRYPINWEN